MTRVDAAVPPAPRRRGPWIAGSIAAALVLGAGGYTAACALTPLPAPHLNPVDPSEWDTAAGDSSALATSTVEQLVAAQSGPAAVGWQGSDAVWSSDNEPRPIASISKLVTVLVGLERAPLAPGEDGPVHVWSEADAARQRAYLAADGVAFPIPVGTEVTTRQMLTLALLPSANDFAAAYAAMTIGDDTELQAAVADWAERHGLATLTFVEPTGMDEANVASAADVVRIGLLALESPTLTEFTRMTSAELPWGIGAVANTNPLLTQLPGTIGLKTGRSSVAGFNLVAAQESTVSGRAVVKVAAVLGRDSGAERARQTSALLTGMDTAAQPFSLVLPQDLAGTAVTIDGVHVELVADGSATTVLLPGESVTRSVNLAPITAGPAGQSAGSLTLTAPTGDTEIPVVTATPIREPDLWWRLTHPALVFGWTDPPTR